MNVRLTEILRMRTILWMKTGQDIRRLKTLHWRMCLATEPALAMLHQGGRR